MCSISRNHFTRLADLIHGASVSRPVARQAHVSAIFSIETGQGTIEKKFTRSINGSTAEHRIDEKFVNPKEYLAGDDDDALFSK